MDETVKGLGYVWMITGKEQVSICPRTVDHYLNINEIFMGFFETAMTDAQTLFTLF